MNLLNNAICYFRVRLQISMSCAATREIPLLEIIPFFVWNMFFMQFRERESVQYKISQSFLIEHFFFQYKLALMYWIYSSLLFLLGKLSKILSTYDFFFKLFFVSVNVPQKLSREMLFTLSKKDDYYDHASYLEWNNRSIVYLCLLFKYKLCGWFFFSSIVSLLFLLF